MEQTQANHQQSNNPIPPAPYRKLERRDAKLAGVAGGLGAYFDIDPTIIRVLLIVATLVSGPVVPLLYVAAWIIMPPAPPTTTAPSTWAPAPAEAPTQAPVVDAHGDSTDGQATAAHQT